MARKRVYIGTDPSIDPAEPDPLQRLHSPAPLTPSPSFPWSGVYAVPDKAHRLIGSDIGIRPTTPPHIDPSPSTKTTGFRLEALRKN